MSVYIIKYSTEKSYIKMLKYYIFTQ